MTTDKILILGVTASGKGQLALGLAKSLKAEIISIDSMKVYRRMDIGTAKPSKQAQQQARYHLIDIVEPSDSFSVGTFLEHALRAIEQINNRNKRVVAVGGTALYIKALLHGLFDGPPADEQFRAELQTLAGTKGLTELYRELILVDPVAAERIDPNDAKRIIRALEVHKTTGKPISSFQKQWDEYNKLHEWVLIGLRREKFEENKRINTRVKKMFTSGLVDEVKSLLAEDKPLSKQARCAIGYAETIEYLTGRLTLNEAIEQTKKNTRRLAKNQRTWFKTFRNVHWLDLTSDEPVEKILERAKRIYADKT